MSVCVLCVYREELGGGSLHSGMKSLLSLQGKSPPLALHNIASGLQQKAGYVMIHIPRVSLQAELWCQ